MTLQTMSAYQAARVHSFEHRSVCCLRVEFAEVTSQRVQLRQINHSFSSVCCVSLLAQGKQCEVGYKVGPSHTLLSSGDSPSPVLLLWQRGEKSTPFKHRGLELLRGLLECCCCVGEGVLVLFQHEQVSQKEKIGTRIDGRNKHEVHE